MEVRLDGFRVPRQRDEVAVTHAILRLLRGRIRHIPACWSTESTMESTTEAASVWVGGGGSM